MPGRRELGRQFAMRGFLRNEGNWRCEGPMDEGSSNESLRRGLTTQFRAYWLVLGNWKILFVNLVPLVREISF